MCESLKSNTEIISFGNTSRRTQHPDREHQELLQCLKEFRVDYPTGWRSNEEQIAFAYFNNRKGYRPIALDKKTEAAKDVRNITVFISDLGFTTTDRFITEAGNEYLKDDITRNKWELTNLSYLFAIQFLKWRGDKEDDFKVYPFLALAYCCLEFNNELPYDFLKYLWTTLKEPEDFKSAIKDYKNYRNKGKENEYINKRISLGIKQSSNYKKLLRNLSKINEYEIDSSKKLEDMFKGQCIVPHGKGGTYLIPTYKWFLQLLHYWEKKDEFNLEEKIEFAWEKVIGGVDGKKGRHCIKNQLHAKEFNKFFFGEEKVSLTKLSKEHINHFENLDLLRAKKRKDFLVEFHVIYCLLTKHVNINEYEDLNFRHIALCDFFTLSYQSVKLKIHFKYFFEAVKDKLLHADLYENKEEEYRKKLEAHHTSFDDAHSFLDESFDKLMERVKINEPYVKKLGLHGYEEKLRMQKLNNLIDSIWTKSNLISLFNILIETNNVDTRDKNLNNKIEKISGGLKINSETPAIFEYLIAIAFFHLSNKQADLKKITKSLDDNGFPTTHARGGEPDIKFEYKSNSYLIEVTLSEGDAQRAMEAEPVPRHMASHILEGNKKSICFFIAKKLDPNNLTILRAYKYLNWYGKGDKTINTMNIFPLELKDLINCLKKEDNFESILEKAELLLESEETDGYQWYKNEIEPAFK